MEEHVKKLSKMSPASHETLKKVMPESLLGIKRSRFSISNSYGSVLIGGVTYEKNSHQSLKMTITDGAGQTGSAVMSMAIFGLNSDIEEETETGFTKTVDMDGR